MKLNNRGWGLQMMIVFTLILMIALVIVAVLASQLFGTLGITGNPLNPGDNPQVEEKPSKKTYQDLEQQVVEASKKYQKKFYSDMLDREKITVTIKTMKNQKLIDSIYDVKDATKECSGYAVFTLTEDKYDYRAYIKCDKYTTKGYLDYLDI